MARVTPVPTLTCPVCGAKLRAVNTGGPTLRGLTAGDWLVCMACGSILRFLPTDTLIEVTEEEIHPLRMAEYQQMKMIYRRKKAKLN